MSDRGAISTAAGQTPFCTGWSEEEYSFS